MLNYFVLLSLLCCVFGDDVMSVMEGDTVTLNTGVTKPQHEPVLWYFNDILIALINGDPRTSCLYDGEGGIFRDRLKVDYQTGSLNITDIRSEHTGRYEAKHIRGESSGTSLRLNRNPKCNRTKIDRKTSGTDDIIKTFSVTVSESGMERKGQQDPGKITGSGLSSEAVAGISVGVVGVVLLVFVAVAAGVIYYRPRRSKKDTTNQDVPLNVQERGQRSPDDSVSLEIQDSD